MKSRKSTAPAQANTLSLDELHDELFPPSEVEERQQADERISSILVGKLIKEYRLKHGLTQEQLAQKIEARKGFISRIENGYVDPQLSTIYRILETGMGLEIEIKVKEREHAKRHSSS